MTIEGLLTAKVSEAVEACFGVKIEEKDVQLQATRKEFAGDLTVVVFPFTRLSRKSPEETGKILGEYLKEKIEEIKDYNVVKGFLNIEISSAYWVGVLNDIDSLEKYGYANEPSGRKIMIEYSSPNTNKPLHLGHIRNNLLGWSVSEIQKANGHDVMMVTLVNDRGVHICKSMVAWQHFANGATPESTGIKGDHLVGDYYVAFDKAYKSQIKELMDQGMDEDSAKKSAPIMVEAQEMLRKWEAGDPEVLKLWSMMNGWVLKGFDESYARLGVTFDKTYFESQTYKKGKDTVLKGLADGVLYQKETGSVWCDLTPDGLDHKLLLRDDGTSVYMTQDIGTAQDRFNEFNPDEQIYVVGNEQNYHFQVLKLILKKLGFDWSDSIYHLSYGMVELPEGKMKSREGTVVDADDLVQDMYATAKETSLALGRLDDMQEAEKEDLFEMIGLGALKYFILKVDPKKTMLFDPKESIDFNGNTGPFIQYTHARIKSILRKAAERGFAQEITPAAALLPKEIEIIKMLNIYPQRVKEAGDDHSPAVIANYAYDLAKEFSQYYHDTTILNEADAALRSQRLALIDVIAKVLVSAMDILGIRLPERM